LTSTIIPSVFGIVGFGMIVRTSLLFSALALRSACLRLLRAAPSAAAAQRWKRRSCAHGALALCGILSQRLLSLTPCHAQVNACSKLYTGRGKKPGF